MSEERRPRAFATLAAASASSAASSRRDGGLAAGLFALPILVMAVVGFALQGYSDPVFTVGWIDRAGTAASAALRADLDAEQTVRLRDYDEVEPMRAGVYRGRVHVGIVVPEGWSGSGDVDLHASGASLAGVVVRSIVEAAMGRAAMGGEAAPRVPSRVAGGGVEGSPPIGFHYTAPSNLVMFVMLTGIISSAGLLNLRRQGIARRLLATPARTWELILLFAVGPAQIMTVQAIFLIGSSWLAFQVPWGSLLGLLVLTPSLIAVGVGASLFAGTMFRTPEQAFSLAPLLGMTLGMLGGCMWPLSIVPPWLRDAGHLVPTAWAMDGYLALIFDRAPASTVFAPAAVLLAMSLVLGGVGVLRLRGRLAT